MRTLSKLRSTLVHLKDKRSLEDSAGLVYQIPYIDCDKMYVGETGQDVWSKEGGTQIRSRNSPKMTISASQRRRRRQQSTNLLSVIMWLKRTIEWKKSKILWTAVCVQREQERTMNCDMGHFHIIPILSDRETADTPSTASQRQSDEACSKQ